MDRLGRMQEVAARAGGSQRGGDLLPDQPGFAHPGHDHAAVGREHTINRVAKRVIQLVGQRHDSLRFGAEHFARETELFKSRQRRLPGASGFMRHSTSSLT
ncbi:MAG: hypothetical protein R3C99_17630 [Pirellulaceae bacterium]